MRPTAGVPWDIVRGQIICTTMSQVVEALQLLAMEGSILIIQVNNRFEEPAAGWADVGMYLFFDSPDCDGVVAEIQIVHEKLMLVREQMGAHDSYDKSRCASELLKSKLINWDTAVSSLSEESTVADKMVRRLSLANL